MRRQSPIVDIAKNNMLRTQATASSRWIPWVPNRSRTARAVHAALEDAANSRAGIGGHRLDVDATSTPDAARRLDDRISEEDRRRIGGLDRVFGKLIVRCAAR